MEYFGIFQCILIVPERDFCGVLRERIGPAAFRQNEFFGLFAMEFRFQFEILVK